MRASPAWRRLVVKNEFVILTNLLHCYEMHGHNLKTLRYISCCNIKTLGNCLIVPFIVLDRLDAVHTSIRGHFLLLIYPPPTKGCLMGIGSFDLYHPIPDFSEYSFSGGYKSSPILACVPYNIQESFAQKGKQQIQYNIIRL